MIDFNKITSNDISDEMLAAYIDGNSTENEKSLIESVLSEDSMLSEAVDIASDTKSLYSEIDWELYKGDMGFWEFGLSPIVTETDLSSMNKTETNMVAKTYGYEPNNVLDTFDPNIWQGNQPTCAVRSQEIILRDYGIFHSQEDLVEFATQNGWFNPDPQNGGTDKYAVGNILDACGIPTTRTDNATVYDIISELRAGHRVIVSVDADELWVKKEPNLFKRVWTQVTNAANDKIQNFLGIEGANHALIVAGVNINPNDPSDIKVTLIDSGTGDVCIEYNFKEFHDAWMDGHCRMISTDIPAPFQYNYETQQIEPSNIATPYAVSLNDMSDTIANKFTLSEDFFNTYKNFLPEYDETVETDELGEPNLAQYNDSPNSDTQSSCSEENDIEEYDDSDNDYSLRDNEEDDTLELPETYSESIDDNEVEMHEEQDLTCYNEDGETE